MDGLTAFPDYMTREGAETLASRIRAFWMKRGRKVQTYVESRNSEMGNAQRYYVVRSDLDLTK